MRRRNNCLESSLWREDVVWGEALEGIHLVSKFTLEIANAIERMFVVSAEGNVPSFLGFSKSSSFSAVVVLQ